MILLNLEFPLSYVPLNLILRVNWFMAMCILLINSHKLSEARSSVKEMLYILTILVGSFFSELGFHTSILCMGLNFPPPPPYIDGVLYFYILVLLEYLFQQRVEDHLSQC